MGDTLEMNCVEKHRCMHLKWAAIIPADTRCTGKWVDSSGGLKSRISEQKILPPIYKWMQQVWYQLGCGNTGTNHFKLFYTLTSVSALAAVLESSHWEIQMWKSASLIHRAALITVLWPTEKFLNLMTNLLRWRQKLGELKCSVHY